MQESNAGLLCRDILVVEDEPTLREIMVLALEDLGARVVAVETADQGLTAVSTLRPDLLVTDVQTPGTLDGWELAWLIHKYDPGIAVIVTSGFHARGNDPLPPNAAFLPKPWTLDHLYAIVQTKIREHLEDH
jgi:CheY-like chemotaxis protein